MRSVRLPRCSLRHQVLLWLTCSVTRRSAFAPVLPPRAVPPPHAVPDHAAVLATATATRLYASAPRGDVDDDDDAAKIHNVHRTCVRHFLTQRSVQSFLYLSEQCRDPHTVKWIEDFSGTYNLLNFHGTGAFNLDRFTHWDSLLLEMVEQPQDIVVVSAKRRGAGTGGWSKNNPYLKPRYVEFEIDIDPPSLTSRIISVREQIAKEWVVDLDIVIRAGDKVLESYMDNVLRLREEEDGEGGDHPVVFERTAMAEMNNVNSFNDEVISPLRRGNFDLLMLLATQESVHRVLRELQASSSTRISNNDDEEDSSQDGASSSVSSFEWLRDFYVTRVGTFFDGEQKFGRCDDFLEELLRSAPSIKTGDDGTNSVSLIDPLGLAETIVRTRGEVAEEWKVIVADVPEDHMHLRRNLIARKMVKSSSASSEQGVEKDVGFE